MASVAARTVEVGFQPEWDPAAGEAGHRGLLAWDPRVRTLLKVLVSYSEVRYILADRISLDGAVDPRLLETIARFLERQRWLVRRVKVS